MKCVSELEIGVSGDFVCLLFLVGLVIGCPVGVGLGRQWYFFFPS